MLQKEGASRHAEEYHLRILSPVLRMRAKWTITIFTIFTRANTLNNNAFSMKKISALVLSLALGGTLAAQTPKFTPDHGALLDGKTIVKANLTSPAFRNYSFAVERVLTKGLGLQLGVATMPKGSLPFASALDKLGGETSLTDLKIKSFYLTPELRWYTGGGYGHGFYLMAYYRYQTYNLSGYDLKAKVSTSSSANEKEIRLALSGDIKSNTIGVGLGAQWFLGSNKNIVLDWNIVGVHAGKAKLTLTGDYSSNSGLTDQEIEDLRKQVGENISELPVVKIADQDVKIDPNKKNVSLDNITSPWGWLRASLSIGFRF